MNDDLETLEAELGGRLRLTLQTVADHAAVPDASPLVRRRWRRAAATALAALISIGGVAAFMAQNDDAIVRLPVEEALMSGETASGDWWLLPTDAVVDGCGSVTAGVVMVAEEINQPGGELNAGGVAYGEPSSSNAACAPLDEEAWLENPSRSDIGHTRLGFERGDTPWGVYGTFHPTIRSVRVNAQGAAPFVVATVARDDRPNGPRYVAFSLPEDTASAQIELVNAEGTIVARVDRTFR